MKKCGIRTEVYSRVVGYFRPLRHWNNGKRQEFKDRKMFEVGSQAVKERHDEEKERPDTEYEDWKEQLGGMTS